MLPFLDAQRMVLGAVRPLPPCPCPLEGALDRVLAEDVVARVSIPPFLNCAMDGFALRWEDLGTPCAILAAQPAGTLAHIRVAPGTALGVTTGAALPEGADTVVPQEHTRIEGGLLHVLKPPPKGAHLRQAGEDVAQGKVALHRGTPLRPGEIGLLAALGEATVMVHPAPRVAVITTGDELVDVRAPLGPAQIRDANIHALCAQVREAGALPIPFPRIPDEPDALQGALEQAFQHADVVCTNGGVSVGERDHVKEVLGRLGAQRQFWQVAQKPGRPLAFHLWRHQPVFGLPGNPVAAMLCFELFVRPALRLMMGHTRLHRPTLEATLGVPLHKPASDRRTHVVRMALEHRDGRLVALPTGPQGSGLLTSMTRAQALLVLPEDAVDPQAGDRVTLHLLEGVGMG